MDLIGLQARHVAFYALNKCSPLRDAFAKGESVNPLYRIFAWDFGGMP